MDKKHLTKEYIKNDYPIIIRILVPCMMIFFGLLIIGTFCLMWNNDIAFYIPFGIIGGLSIFFFIIPYIIRIIKEFKIYNRVKKYEFEIKRYIMIDKNYAFLDEINESDIISGKADKDVVFLKDDDNNIIPEMARTSIFVDAKIGDEFYRVIIEGYKEVFYYSGKEYYI